MLFAFATVVFMLGIFIGTTFFHMHDGAAASDAKPWNTLTQTGAAIPTGPPLPPAQPRAAMAQPTPFEAPLPSVPAPQQQQQRPQLLHKLLSSSAPPVIDLVGSCWVTVAQNPCRSVMCLH